MTFESIIYSYFQNYERFNYSYINSEGISDIDKLIMTVCFFISFVIRTVVRCHLCRPLDEPGDPDQGVMNYPHKAKKKPPREQKVTIKRNFSLFLLLKICGYVFT